MGAVAGFAEDDESHDDSQLRSRSLEGLPLAQTSNQNSNKAAGFTQTKIKPNEDILQAEDDESHDDSQLRSRSLEGSPLAQTSNQNSNKAACFTQTKIK